jgi:phenylacetate-CoA ligase
MDQVEIKAEIRPESDYPETRKTAAERLGQAIKDTIGITARVNVLDPEGIERSLGKARRVIDRRPKE